MRYDRIGDGRNRGRGDKRRNDKRRDDMMSIINLLNDTDISPRNPPRDKYEQEEGIFIWYNRLDLGLPWNRVQENFQHQFHKRRGKGGLQCKYYRVLDAYGIKKVRHQGPRGSRRAQGRAEWGVIARTSIRYPWMLPYHQDMPPNIKPKL